MQPVEFELKSMRNGSLLIVWLCGRLTADGGENLKRLALEISKQEVDHVLLDLSKLTHVGAGIMPSLERLAAKAIAEGVDVRLCLVPGDLKANLADLARSPNISSDRRRAA